MKPICQHGQNARQCQLCEYAKDLAELTTINTGLVTALNKIANYPVNVDGYNSASAVKLRMVAMQTIARAAL